MSDGSRHWAARLGQFCALAVAVGLPLAGLSSATVVVSGIVFGWLRAVNVLPIIAAFTLPFAGQYWVFGARPNAIDTGIGLGFGILGAPVLAIGAFALMGTTSMSPLLGAVPPVLMLCCVVGGIAWMITEASRGAKRLLPVILLALIGALLLGASQWYFDDLVARRIGGPTRTSEFGLFGEPVPDDAWGVQQDATLVWAVPACFALASAAGISGSRAIRLRVRREMSVVSQGGS